MKNKNPKAAPKRSSEVLREIAENKHLRKKLTYQHIVDTLGERAFGIMILFFSLPSLFPVSVVPGVAVIFSLPIIIFTLEMVFGSDSLWLPKFIANKQISHAHLSRIISVVLPYIMKLERLTKPRWTFMTCPTANIIRDIAIFCLALLLMLPIPFSNVILGILLVIFSIGIIENDGVFIFVGLILFILYASFLVLIGSKIFAAFLFITDST